MKPIVKKAKMKTKSKYKIKTVSKNITSQKHYKKPIDTECLLCGELWSNSHPGEEWVKCMKCHLWFHEDCCTSFSKTGVTCDFCL